MISRFKWESDSFFNYLGELLPTNRNLYDDIQVQMQLMHSSHSIDGSVQFHKRRLGKQAFCWQGSGHRFWIWEGKNWRGFANNDHGTSFEVRASLSVSEALEAFQDYRRKVGLTK